jgi:16S rRNA processing protein RimM
MTASDSDFVVVGKITSSYGIRGWVKVHSFTEPLTNILDYNPWYLKQDNQWREFVLSEGRPHGKGIVAHLKTIDDRNQADLLRGCEIAVTRTQIPEAEAGEYYWIDLIGCRVQTLEGEDLGVVEEMMETGANDVLVVRGERERLIPYVVDEIVKDVDIGEKLIRVDWPADF